MSSSNKNFDLMFVTPSRESEEWDNKAYELSKKGDLEGWDNLLRQANELYLDEYHIYNTIQQLTIDDAEKDRLLKQLESCRIVKKVKTFEDGTTMIVTNKDEHDNPDIVFIKLSDLIPDLNDDYNLGSWNRNGKCHTKAKKISLRLGMPNEVVTGYFHTMSDKARFLHSWVEFSEAGEDYVIDYTMNVVMNKRGYYFIRHACELCRIKDSDILSDGELFSQLGCLDDKEYLVFRHEIASDLEKNKAAFQKTL